MTEPSKRVRIRLSWTLLVAGVVCGAATLVLLGIAAGQLATRQLRPQAEPGHWTSLWLDLACYPLAGACLAGLLLHIAWKLRR